MKIMVFRPQRHVILRLLNKVGVDEEVKEYMADKMSSYNIFVEPVSLPVANILKQTSLTVGADVAVHRDVITGRYKFGGILIMATYNQLEKMRDKLTNQPWKIKNIMDNIINVIDYKPSLWKIKDRSLDLSKPIIMGILNVTPDSFYDGGKYIDEESIKERVEKMIDEGVDIIDIGGQSSRPFSSPVSEEEEWNRVKDAIRIVRSITDIPISIDTYRSGVAKKAIEEGCDIVNDISGLRFDSNMVDVIRDTGCGVVLMHIKGTPENMQKDPHYDFLFDEIYSYLEESVNMLIEKGVERERIVIDPGIGFGKRTEDNLQIIDNLSFLKGLRLPILIGLSRKSFIGNVLNEKDPVNRLNGTTVIHTFSLDRGADILRVHDIREAKETVLLKEALYGSFDII